MLEDTNSLDAVHLKSRHSGSINSTSVTNSLDAVHLKSRHSGSINSTSVTNSLDAAHLKSRHSGSINSTSVTFTHFEAYFLYYVSEEANTCSPVRKVLFLLQNARYFAKKTSCQTTVVKLAVGSHCCYCSLLAVVDLPSQ